MEPQKYKIYVNGTPVFLTSRNALSSLPYTPDAHTLVNFYSGKKKQLKNFFDLLEKGNYVRVLVLWAEDVAQLREDFYACFTPIAAAGGIVENEVGELLVFFRRGSWDLPKGKIDPGETPEMAAVREVQEETGLVHVEIEKFVAHTFHTYRQNKIRMLKKTWWYKMKTTDHQLIPQTEEDIEKIEWVEPKKWLESNPKLYGSIQEILQDFYLS